jgi:hypothetical protein
MSIADTVMPARVACWKPWRLTALAIVAVASEPKTLAEQQSFVVGLAFRNRAQQNLDFVTGGEDVRRRHPQTLLRIGNSGLKLSQDTGSARRQVKIGNIFDVKCGNLYWRRTDGLCRSRSAFHRPDCDTPFVKRLAEVPAESFRELCVVTYTDPPFACALESPVAMQRLLVGRVGLDQVTAAQRHGFRVDDQELPVHVRIRQAEDPDFGAGGTESARTGRILWRSGIQQNTNCDA